MTVQLPRETMEKYEGQWVAWDTDTGEFLAAADTVDDLFDKLEPIPKERVVGFERVIPRDAVIVGGYWG